MAVKKKKTNEISVSEFKSWISGIEDMQEDGWVPNKVQWDKIKSKIIDDEQFWNILNYEQWVIFQSLNQIYIYDTKTQKFSIIPSSKGILKSFQVDNAIYFQVANDGLFEIENGKQKLIFQKV